MHLRMKLVSPIHEDIEENNYLDDVAKDNSLDRTEEDLKTSLSPSKDSSLSAKRKT